MTFAIGHVTGGTNAGRKIQKPAPKPWLCECADTSFAGRIIDPQLCGVRKEQPAYMSRCPDCKQERP